MTAWHPHCYRSVETLERSKTSAHNAALNRPRKQLVTRPDVSKAGADQTLAQNNETSDLCLNIPVPRTQTHERAAQIGGGEGELERGAGVG